MSIPMFTRKDQGEFQVNPAVMYPHYLRMIGAAGSTQVNQVQLEVCRLCFTEDMCKVFGTPLHLVISRDDKYRLDRYPAGEGNIRMTAQAIYASLPETPAKRLGIVS